MVGELHVLVDQVYRAESRRILATLANEVETEEGKVHIHADVPRESH